MEHSQYVICGGVQGRERLRILSRVMRPATLDLLRRAGACPGMVCIDAGCGGGDVAFDLAQIVGPAGKVVAIDFDRTKLDLARREAQDRGLANVEFRGADLAREGYDGTFDLIHARFLLTHLPNPEAALAKMHQALRPGGVVVVADIDYRGYFCHPDCAAVWRHVDWYKRVVQLNGGDACVGPRLPALLSAAGFQNVRMNIVQPAGTEGDVKLMTPLTMENIAPAVLAAGLASQAEIDRTVAELYEYARTPGTVGCLPRIVESWGYKPNEPADPLGLV